MSENVLKRIGKEIWMAEGPTVSFFGFPYPTRMVIVRLHDGKLWVWSPIALRDKLIKEINLLGEVMYLISPNKLHHLFMGEWKKEWPEAELFASPGLKKKRKDLHFTKELEDNPDPAWKHEIDQVIVHGSFFMEEVLFFHKPSRTLLVGDLIQRFDPGKTRGFVGLMMKLDSLVGENGSTPREWRLSFIFQKKKAQKAIRKALEWKPGQMIIAHGKCAWKNPTKVVRRSLRWIGIKN